MRLEDTIRHRLYSTRISQYSRETIDSFVIECKAEAGKPVPLCIPNGITERISLVYRKLYLVNDMCQERSTPRALFNLIFSTYYTNCSLFKVKLKQATYYTAPGVLFNADKQPLFYFARDIDPTGDGDKPILYLTPRLLSNAFTAGNPMEKFFMSTIVPFLVDNLIYVEHNARRTTILIDNDIDNTFFIPSGRLISMIPVDDINNHINGILADNADTISVFAENYSRNQ